jgi:hypothetical protein
MTIINIVEVLEGVPHIVRSFPIYEEKLSSDVLEEAENVFKKILWENGVYDDDLDYLTEEKEYADDNGYAAYIIYSYTD